MFKALFSASSSLYISVFTLLNGKRVGTDQLGNIYYSAKPRRGTRRERRWVMYNGPVEASRVPAEWHGWLHHQTDLIPQDNNPLRRDWQMPHQPNLTGTSNAYVPPGHVLRGAHRDKATGDYQAWTPPAK